MVPGLSLQKWRAKVTFRVWKGGEGGEDTNDLHNGLVKTWEFVLNFVDWEREMVRTFAGRVLTDLLKTSY